MTVGCARQHVAFSHLLGVHCTPFTCCFCSVGDSRKHGQLPLRTPWSSSQGAQLLPPPQCTTAPGSGFPLVLHTPPGTASCCLQLRIRGGQKARKTQGVLKGEVRNSHLLRFSTPLTICCLQSSVPCRPLCPLHSSGPFHHVQIDSSRPKDLDPHW